MRYLEIKGYTKLILENKGQNRHLKHFIGIQDDLFKWTLEFIYRYILVHILWQ